MTRPPARLDASGRRLWRGTLDRWPEMPEPERTILLDACRTADILDRLAELAASGDGDLDVVLREQRQQALSLARLLAVLRLPDRVTGKRPRYRGTRGVYGPRGGPQLF